MKQLALTDRKITDTQISTNGVVSAPDKLTGTVAQNKAIFDNLIKTTVKTELNGVIDDLTATTDGASGADQIGATSISGLAGGTVQSLLEALNTAEKADKSATDTALALKVDKVTGKGLSTNDYTTAEQSKLSGIATGAEVNVNADWNAISGDAQILNKPTTFTPSAHTQAVSTITDFDTEVSNNTDVAANTSARHTHSNKATLDDITAAYTTTEKTKLAAISGTNTGDETTATIGTLIDGATEKITPVDADMVGLMDSVASNVLKKLSWANIKATLNAYFTDLFAPISHVLDNFKHIPTVTAAGTANTYTATISGLASYVDGLKVWVKIPATNTGASTINFNGLGVKAIGTTGGLSLSANALWANEWYLLVYNSNWGNFVISSRQYNDADLNSYQTLVNKTLTSPTINTPTINSATITGTLTVPTATTGDNSTKAATTAFVQNSLSAAGYGDMLKSVYDINGDGSVDSVNNFTVIKNTTTGIIELWEV